MHGFNTKAAMVSCSRSSNFVPSNLGGMVRYSRSKNFDPRNFGGMTWEEFVANDTLGPDGSNLNRPDSPIWTGVNEETGGVEEYRESEQRYQSVLYDESDAKDNKLVGSKEPNQTFRFREKPTTKQVLDAVAATVDNDFLIQNHLAASRDLAELDTLAQLNEMKLRKSAKTARKANKNVKTSIVVQGNSEEYSIENVLQFSK